MSSKRQFNLLVTGDVVVDHHLYEGGWNTTTADHKHGVCDLRELGGAAVLAQLLRETFIKANDTAWNVDLGITPPPLDECPRSHHAYAFWSPYFKDKDEGKKKEDKQEKVWRAQFPMGYGQTEAVASPRIEDSLPCSPHLPHPKADLPKPHILVLDDAGYRFRHQDRKDCWLLPRDEAPLTQWIVLKMAQSIAQGDLWHEVIYRFDRRLVCIVSAHELRQECVNISRGLSWERTVEEVREALLNSPSLSPLTRCRHLIVRFSADGALWLDGSDPSSPQARLVFDAAGAEGAWEDNREGTAFGSSTTLTSAITLGLARVGTRATVSGQNERQELASSIRAGLAALRNLQENGHGPLGRDVPTGFPVKRLAAIITQRDAKFADAEVLWPKPGETLPDSDRAWMIVEASQRPEGLKTYPPLVGLARQVVLGGKTALDEYPHARFGKLMTIDRFEIEMLRSLRRLMVAYERKGRAEKPLSIGVFGPPGAGKSFGVKQIAEEVFGEKSWLEFNLSQFNGPPDLIGAFHQVRDRVLSGVTPVVFWDEFDSKSYVWLQYLLAPMQDGRFQEGQISHWVGKCVFVFAGGTSPTFGEFEPPQGAPTEVLREYKLSKGPDFHSRLDAYYNVVGPNRRTLPRTKWDPNAPREPDPSDVCFPLRRALLMRSLLGCKNDERLDFDSDLLDALLLVPEYKHGARSLEKVVAELRLKDGGPIRRSALPPPALLAMHVDAQAFHMLLTRNEGFRNSQMIEALAAAIHQNYLDLSRKEGLPVEPHFDKLYDRLAPVHKEPNRAAARRIPRVLALVGASVAMIDETVASGAPSRDDASTYLKFHRERLAEEEHNAWMEERFASGWRYGAPRDNLRKLHPLLVAYNALPEEQKNKDRGSIDGIPEIVAKAGYRIVWLGTEPK